MEGIPTPDRLAPLRATLGEEQTMDAQMGKSEPQGLALSKPQGLASGGELTSNGRGK